jgi:D-glycero-beta-D-manno-heptose 1-phosphate adenylyltransferase
MHRKIISSKYLVALVAKLRKQGKRIVTTNGCFDLLHVGHIKGLQDARAFGDVLIVAVNSDSSVRSIKDPTRPIINQKERMQMLAAFSCVDYVTLFSEKTPEAVLGIIKPDVHVKAGYRMADLPEAVVVRAHGGRVVALPRLKNSISTTQIIQKIRKIPQ